MIPVTYRAPIVIQDDDVIKVKQCITSHGKNRGATFDPVTKTFEINDNIVLKIDSKLYRLQEYHFHIPSDDIINCKRYPAEIHYTFIEIENDEKPCKKNRKRRDVCEPPSSLSNLVVIGRLLKNDPCRTGVDYARIQVEVPHTYFEYDGSLPSGTFGPARWIVGDRPLYVNVAELVPIARGIRQIQNRDGRIVLYGRNVCGGN